MVSKSSGRNKSERKVASKNSRSNRPKPSELGEGSMARRKLTEAANHFGGVLATARWQGRIKQLEKPSLSQREIAGADLTYNRQHREKERWREGGGRASSSEETA